MAAIVARRGQVVSEPRLVEAILSDPRAGWLWLVLRIWLGWQWIEAAEHKIFDPK